jgi:hypothetical protein
MKNKIFSCSTILAVCLVFCSCQKMDEPALGDYPKDSSPPGGPLKFYAAFDGTTSNVLFNAVDSIRANFAAANPLTAITGISGKAVQGSDGKGVKYNSVNDFMLQDNPSSYTISFWLKSAVPPGDRYETVFSFAQQDLYYRAAIHFDIYSGNYGSTATNAFGYFYMEQANGDYIDKEYSGSTGIPNLLDNQWHQLVFTYDETTSQLKLYKDAVLVHTLNWTGHGKFVPVDLVNYPSKAPLGLAIAASNRQVGIDAANDGWMTTWSGGIDQFRVYGKKALTQAEITSLFNSKL